MLLANLVRKMEMWRGSLHVFQSLTCEEDERGSHSCNWLLLYVAFLAGRIVFNG